MDTASIQQERRFALSEDELAYWNENGYLVRLDVFTPEENDAFRQVAEDIVDGKRPFPPEHIDRNALVRDGKVEEQGIYAMHKIHFPSCYDPAFLARVRDPRLTDPIVDILGPDILGINTLFIWKAPKIGLGFPWHQDRWYFNRQYKTDKTVGTWTAIDASDVDNGCLYVIPGSHKDGVLDHEDLEGSQQNEFKSARGAKDEDGVAVEVPPGSVIFFDNRLLHKSTDNNSGCFRRCNVAHYISADSERLPYKNINHIKPVMWVRGDAYSEKMEPVYRDALPIPEEPEN